MGLLDHAQLVDAKRFETIAHAIVMTSGRLRFATDAMELMGLSEVKGIMLFSLNTRCYPDDDVEYAAVTCKEEDTRAFSLKTSGPYKYLSLKNFLIKEGINFKDYSTSFEVTEANEMYEGDKQVFRLTMRQTPKSKGSAAAEQTEESAGADIPF